jgi:hypothetical protein
MFLHTSFRVHADVVPNFFTGYLFFIVVAQCPGHYKNVITRK